jgi:outer membrane protein OmpA-like peptidoglycan-associated protein
MKRNLWRTGLVFCLLLGLVAPVWAQGDVMKNSEVSEAALIDALAVPADAGASDVVGATRGFRPARPGQAVATKPAGPGKASLMITFQTNSTQLTSESERVLNILARALQSDALAGFSFRIEGHADARGDPERNLQLSQLRAESVARYLVDHQGILAERLEALGKGSSEPLNKTRVDAPENRRVTIITNRN